jgi:hypothetical protein
MSSNHFTRRILAAALALAPAAVLAGGAAGAVAAPVVWDSSAGGNGNTYDVVVNNTISWDAAQAAAQAAGGDLATITSQAEQNFVNSLLTSAAVPTGSYWFGIRETGTEGVYKNVTGEALGFTNWAAGEPNNAKNIESVGAVLWTAADGTDPGAIARRGQWNDEAMAGYPTPGIPTPTQPDVMRGGYLIEIRGDDNGGGGGNGGGGEPNAVPLPAAAYAFPVGAAFAGYFYRRVRRTASAS